MYEVVKSKCNPSIHWIPHTPRKKQTSIYSANTRSIPLKLFRVRGTWSAIRNRFAKKKLRQKFNNNLWKKIGSCPHLEGGVAGPRPRASSVVELRAVHSWSDDATLDTRRGMLWRGWVHQWSGAEARTLRNKKKTEKLTPRWEFTKREGRCTGWVQTLKYNLLTKNY